MSKSHLVRRKPDLRLCFRFSFLSSQTRKQKLFEYETDENALSVFVLFITSNLLHNKLSSPFP